MLVLQVVLVGMETCTAKGIIPKWCLPGTCYELWGVLRDEIQ